ncbi:MAG: diiron oxygenase [Verrucomicrobia bacterium]|nr:diiron oxygenase [Verrucomicrobiota bacterium]
MTAYSDLLFLPEDLTPLYHTSVYAELDPEQKRRYNQLTGLYFNEQIVFFEILLAEYFLKPMVARLEDEQIREKLEQFIDEESEHTQMFCALNRDVAPEWYSNQSFYLVKPRPTWLRVLKFVCSRPLRFPFLIWLCMIQEERAVYFGKRFVASDGRVDPRFVEAHRRHLEDEEDHYDVDLLLRDLYWHSSSWKTRLWNARFFSWVTFEFFTAPKRAGVRIFDVLADEFPSLKRWRPTVVRAYGRLGGLPAYMHHHYGPVSIAHTVDELRKYPEFIPMVKRFEALWPEQAQPS